MGDSDAESAVDPSAAHNAVPSAPYLLRCPSPPFIHVPPVTQATERPLSLMPSFDNVDASQLDSRDLAVITQNALRVPTPPTWTYEKRRAAQPVLDFLYLGPNSAARDADFLRREAITMVLVARDARMAATRLRGVDAAAGALGVEVRYLDVEGPHQLVRGFPETIRLINDHLLAVYRGQARGRGEGGGLLVEAAGFRRGKVLVTCESGNDRSGAVVAAYLMAVFGQDMVAALQFVCVQRFCCVFDGDIKRILKSWEDILRARRAVRGEAPGGERAGKRGIEDTVDPEQDAGGSVPALDGDRFTGRDAFVPFTDMS